MTAFILGAIVGGLAVFFAVGWWWHRLVEDAEPIDELSFLADPGDEFSPLSNE